MLEEEIMETCDKWLDELWSTMERMKRASEGGEPFDPSLFRRWANLESLVLSLQAYAHASKDGEEAEAQSGRKPR